MVTTPIPEDFARAYEGLVGLVGRVSGPEAASGRLGEAVDRWRAEHCGNSAVLSRAAAYALRHELGRRGLEGDRGVRDALEVLEAAQGLLEPAPDPMPDGTPQIVEVPLPAHLRRVMPEGRAFRMGELQVLGELRSGHLSVSHPSRLPALEEIETFLRRAGDDLWRDPRPNGARPTLWAMIPKPELAGKLRGKTVHLYVVPPRRLVG